MNAARKRRPSLSSGGAQTPTSPHSGPAGMQNNFDRECNPAVLIKCLAHTGFTRHKQMSVTGQLTAVWPRVVESAG